MKFFARVITPFLVIAWLSGISQAAERVALVIGNSNYQHVSALPNPTNDADDIGDALTRLGFSVTKVKDLDYRNMRLALRQFSQEAVGSQIALIYYAGHGIEVDKQNYLIPTDAQLKTDVDVEFEAMPLDNLNRAVAGAKNLRLILLDACRDNPFAKAMTRTISTRSIGSGLARVEPAVGTLVSYAAKEGTVAADGEGRNSPYTRALIQHLAEPGLEINFLFRKVRDSVIASTNGQQEPFTYGSLPGKQIFLKDPEPTAAVVTPPSNADPSVELTFWDSIKTKNNADYFEAYLQRFPRGLFVEIARLEIDRLRKAEAEQSKNDSQSQVATLTPDNKQNDADQDRRVDTSERNPRLEDMDIRSKECRALFKEHLGEGPIRAFALSSDRQVCGASWRYSTKKTAAAAAIDFCKQQNGKQCKVVWVSEPAVQPKGKECIEAFSDWQKFGGSKAFAITGDGHACGWSYNHPSSNSASNAAIDSCRNQVKNEDHGCHLIN